MHLSDALLDKTGLELWVVQATLKSMNCMNEYAYVHSVLAFCVTSQFSYTSDTSDTLDALDVGKELS